MYKEGGTRTIKRQNVNCIGRRRKREHEDARGEERQKVTSLIWHRPPNRVKISEEKLREKSGYLENWWKLTETDEIEEAEATWRASCNRMPLIVALFLKLFFKIVTTRDP